MREKAIVSAPLTPSRANAHAGPQSAGSQDDIVLGGER